MKKSNWIGLAIAVLIDAFLLWLWYYLGFNRVDEPLDLVISIIWLALVIAIVVVVNRLEKKRDCRLRTIYVAPASLFNKESGVVPVSTGASNIEAMERILKEMRYGFDLKDMPKQEDFDYRFVVETDEYKPAKADGDEPTWKGKVTKIDRQNGNVETAFASQQELQEALKANKESKESIRDAEKIITEGRSGYATADEMFDAME